MDLKFIYSEKATIFCEISTNYLSYVLPVKYLVEISQNFVAFSEYMNFKNDQKRKLCEPTEICLEKFVEVTSGDFIYGGF